LITSAEKAKKLHLLSHGRASGKTTVKEGPEVEMEEYDES
jgi:hypothetical protein